MSEFHSVIGRYQKLQRGISNSIWVIDGVRKAEESIEEAIALPAHSLFRTDGTFEVLIGVNKELVEHKFASAGREDADVLMLGQGRPFYLELVNPRTLQPTPSEIAQLQSEINAKHQGKVAVSDLQMVSRSDTKVLKDSASSKQKSYRCLVRLSTPVPAEKLASVEQSTPIDIQQRNPTRVPRRSDLVRQKTVLNLQLRQQDDEHLVMVDLTTSAGTYVKEFVHGDDGRTLPNLAELLGVSQAQVEWLDVTQVHLDWPPVIQT